MAELRLTGPAEDGEGLRLLAPDGAEHTLPHSPFLRRLVLEHAEGAEASPPRPEPRPHADEETGGDAPEPVEPRPAAADVVPHAAAEADGDEAPAAVAQPAEPASQIPQPDLTPRIDPPLPAPDAGTAPTAGPLAEPTPARRAITPLADQEDVRAAATQEAAPLAPREIQQRIRSGQSVEQVARESGNAFSRIRTYGYPVLAERAWMAGQARAVEIWVGGPDLYADTAADGGPTTLGELTEHRLRELGVDAATLAWDSWREPSGDWAVTAGFDVPDDAALPTAERPPARWRYRPAGRHLDPVNRWARILSDAESWDVFAPAAPGEPADVDPDTAADPGADAFLAPVDDQPAVTPLGARRPAVDRDADLLEILRVRRGQRVGADADSDDALAHAIAAAASAESRDTAPAEASPSAAPVGPVSAAARRLAGDLGPTDATADDYSWDDEEVAEHTAAPVRALRPTGGEPTPGPASTPPVPCAPVPDVAAAPESTPDPAPEASERPSAHAAPVGRMPVPRPRARTTGRRASVPSWDEIVFGRKGD